MIKLFSFSILILLIACSSTKFSLPDKYPLTQISSEKGIELYKYRSSIGNTCLIGIMSATEDQNVTLVTGILIYDFLASMSSLQKKQLENELNELIKNYEIAIIDDKIMFMDHLNERLSKIPKGLLLERVKNVGEFTCSYSAIFEELLKSGSTEDE